MLGEIGKNQAFEHAEKFSFQDFFQVKKIGFHPLQGVAFNLVYQISSLNRFCTIKYSHTKSLIKPLYAL